MPTYCKPLSFTFQGCQGRKVIAAFDGGSITSNAGALLLRQADRSTGLFDRVAAGFTDHRDQRLIEHSVRTLVAQRITGIALGYDDLNDHDDLRRDPLLALLSGKLEARRKGCAPLAGKSTLSRLEHAPAGGKPSRYARIDHDPEKLQDVLVESFIDSWQGLPRRGWCWTSTRPTLRCTVARRAGSTTAITTTTASCRCTSPVPDAPSSPCSGRATPTPPEA